MVDKINYLFQVLQQYSWGTLFFKKIIFKNIKIFIIYSTWPLLQRWQAGVHTNQIYCWAVYKMNFNYTNRFPSRISYDCFSFKWYVLASLVSKNDIEPVREKGNLLETYLFPHMIDWLPCIRGFQNGSHISIYIHKYPGGFKKLIGSLAYLMSIKRCVLRYRDLSFRIIKLTGDWQLTTNMFPLFRKATKA